MSGLCSRCKGELTTARLVIGGVWVCSECALEAEHGAVERIPRQPLPRKQPRQEETLFPLEAFLRAK